MNFKYKFSGFTLAEMMVVLLVMAIILAAMAPVFTRKSHSNVVPSDNSLWALIKDNSNFAYLKNTDSSGAIIGGITVENTDKFRLILDSNDVIPGHILFKVKHNNRGSLQVSDNQGLLFGSGEVSGKKAIGIGHNSSSTSLDISGNGSVGIGNGIMSNGNGSVAIGNAIGIVGASEAVAIGSGASIDSNSNKAVAIGPESKVGSAFAIALGDGAKINPRSDGSIAIGPDTSIGVNSFHSTAIGVGAKVENGVSGSVAIGERAIANISNTILLGSRESSPSVIIPGTLTSGTTFVHGGLFVHKTSTQPGDFWVDGSTLIKGNTEIRGRLNVPGSICSEGKCVTIGEIYDFIHSSQ